MPLVVLESTSFQSCLVLIQLAHLTNSLQLGIHMLQPFNQSIVTFIFTEAGVTVTNQRNGNTSSFVQNFR